MRSEVRKLSTISAVFNAADGNPRVVSSEAVDENTAGVEIARDLRANSTSLVQRLPLNPNWLALAAWMAESMSGTRVSAATGPNVSSSNAGMPSVTPLSTVGG